MLRKNKKRVLVAMSGGVDSSVAALLLNKGGYDVVGATMCFGLEDSEGSRPTCCSLSGIEDARRVAASLNIPHYVLSFAKQLRENVIEYFLREYSQARTPNPCIRCNQYLKFSILARKAKELGCDYLATGHFARIAVDKNGRGFLKKAKDKDKDQSYFLFRLPKDKMNFVLFPLGEYTKQQVRQIARENNLAVADKPGSQDICFLPRGDYQDFFLSRLGKDKIRPGPIKDLKGNVLGGHKGLVFYTVGQRQGLGIAYKHALYVTKIDKKTNSLFVGQKTDVYKSKLEAKEIYFLRGKTFRKRLEVKAKIRYNHPEAKAILRPLTKDRVVLEFKKPQWAITPGQSVVWYQKDTVIGGATIDKVIED